MPVTWTIEGESGKGWDATARSLEYYGIRGGSVTTGGLEDSLSLDCALGAFDGSTYARPDYHQRVTLKRDGVVYFRGWAMDPQISCGDAFAPRCSVEIMGPGYWLAKQPLRTSRQAQFYVAAASRNTILFPEANPLQDNLDLLVDAYNATMDVSDVRRISRGTVATTWAMQRIEISGGDFLSALQELVAKIPDAHAYWVYQAGSHVASLRVARRDSMTTRTLAAPGACKGARFKRRIDLEASAGVVIDYAEMVDDQSANTGKPRYLQQASTATAGAVAATAQAQRVTTAGPELDSFLPDAPVDNVTVSSAPITQADTVRKLDSAMSGVSAVAEGLNVSGLRIVSEEASKTASLSTHPYFLIKGDPQDWWASLPSNLQLDPVKVKVSATYSFSAYGVNLSQSPNFPWGYYSKPGSTNGQGYVTLTQTGLSRGAWEFCNIAAFDTRTVDLNTYGDLVQSATLYTYTYPASASLTAVNLFVNNQVLYRRPDYTFRAPPANLANNLSAAQNFIPWEGEAKALTDTPGAVGYAGCKLNVTGLFPAWATMGAIITGHQVELFSGLETLNCGVPARFSHLNLADRIRLDPKSNILF